MFADHLSTWALIVGAVTSLAAVAFGIHTWRRTKDMPLSREQMLEQRVDDLEATVRILQDRIRELEDELEHYKTFAGSNGTPIPRRRVTKPKIKRLDIDQLNALRSVLLDTYMTHGQWQTLLGDVGRPIDMVATGDSLRDVASRVLTSANNEGWMKDLLTAAVAGRPDLAALKTLAAELAKALA